MKSDAFVVTAGMGFDGNEFIDGRVGIVVRAGSIEAVGGEVPAGLAVVDFGDDACLLPGLVDTHTHLAFDAGTDPVGSALAASDTELYDTMRRAAQRAVRAGVTTVRDLGDRNFLSLRLRDELAENITGGPEILASGPPITTPGGHCHFLGGETAPVAAELVAAVQERHRRGCAVVKIMVSGGNITPGSLPYESQYTREQLRVVVDEAHRLGLPVAAHVHGLTAIEDAVAAGVDSIEHVTFMTSDGNDPQPRLLAAIAASDTVVSATLGFEPEGMSAMMARLPPELAKRADSVHHAQDAAMRGFLEYGVRVTVGTDAGVAEPKPHDVLPYGVVELERYGWTALDALRIVTKDAADLCGVAGRKGELTVGADADLLVVHDNPLKDLQRLRAVRGVFRLGKRVS